ncbi:hypothetical protein SOVF_182400 [Spinacia oleracea]|nr:hypothetical protein SOVF_182400 [Spinacia oleracea]
MSLLSPVLLQCHTSNNLASATKNKNYSSANLNPTRGFFWFVVSHKKFQQ